VASGLPVHRFCFEGFLPLKKGRHTLLTQLAGEDRTMIFYESPVRLLRTLENFIEYFGENRRCAVAREISKKFEEHVRGTLREVCDHFRAAGVKGEIVIVVEGKN
jgi:16S rRNA (cytidine1402-2'-O)-methyltransferase